MTSSPELAVIVSTFERPGHLERCLASLAAQLGADGQFEVIVTDDGSRDGTAKLVEQFARRANFPVKFVTQPQQGFRLARCRNNGVRAASAPYFLFTDGDCLFPRNHIAEHLRCRQANVVRAGSCFRLTEGETALIDCGAIARDELSTSVERKFHAWRRKIAAKSLVYQTSRDPRRPKLVGANIAVARADFERVNGFDENYVGWGCEDDDFAARLRMAGVKIRTILHRTAAYHLWHPPHSTTPATWSAGKNVERLLNAPRLEACLDGYQKRSARDLKVRVMNRRCRWYHAAFAKGGGPFKPQRCEIELLMLPGDGAFTPRADCRIVVVPVGEALPKRLFDSADIVLRPASEPRTADELYALVEGALSGGQAPVDGLQHAA